MFDVANYEYVETLEDFQGVQTQGDYLLAHEGEISREQAALIFDCRPDQVASIPFRRSGLTLFRRVELLSDLIRAVPSTGCAVRTG